MSLGMHVTPGWQKHIEGDLHGLLEKLGKGIIDDAKRIVPVESGALKASLDYEVEGRTVHVFATEEYAPFVEMGTSKMKAQPYLRPAVFKNHGGA